MASEQQEIVSQEKSSASEQQEIGELRLRDTKTGRYEVVHLENNNLKPCMILTGNFRIVSLTCQKSDIYIAWLDKSV